MRTHLKRAVQVKREKEIMIKAVETSFITIQKKIKRNTAKANREISKRFNASAYDMLAALEEIEQAEIQTVENMFEVMAM
jgi:hypothetical protein